MKDITVKTLLGCVMALGTMADLLWRHDGPITREDVLIHAVFLLFSGVLIDPASFKGLVFWRKADPA